VGVGFEVVVSEVDFEVISDKNFVADLQRASVGRTYDTQSTTTTVARCRENPLHAWCWESRAW